MSLGGTGATVAHLMTSATPDIPYYEISNATGTAAGLQPGKGTPTMIVIHGGGFDAGWRTWDGAPTWYLDGPPTQQLVQRWNDRGWNTYAIEYPKGLDNGVVPVRWFAHQLRGILGSNTTVCATGYSAGGTLSYMLASNGPEGAHGTALDGAQVDYAIYSRGPRTRTTSSTRPARTWPPRAPTRRFRTPRTCPSRCSRPRATGSWASATT